MSHMENISISLLSMPLTPVVLNILLYIDPGTGSLILQAVIASVVGVTIAVKIFWHRILKFFGLKKSSNSDLSNTEDDTEK